MHRAFALAVVLALGAQAVAPPPRDGAASDRTLAQQPLPV